jgi:hypothetical protein
MRAVIRPLQFALATCLILSASATRSRAQVTFYSDSSAFSAAAPGLSTQTFNPTNGTPGEIVGMPTPLDSSTNNGTFAPGDILPGLTITAGSPGPESLAYFASGTFGNTNNEVNANFFGDTLILQFNPSVTAVSAGLLSLFATSDEVVNVFSPTSVLLGTETVTGVPSGGVGLFFGVIATGGNQIGEVTFQSTSGAAAGVDSIQFSTPVPEPGSLALATIGLAGLVGYRARRSRSARA